MFRFPAGSLMALALACSVSASIPHASTEISATPTGLRGEWYCGDGLGYNVSLTLNEDGTYESRSYGCLGTYGSGEGTWTIDGNDVSFDEKSGDMADDLDSAQLIIHCGHIMMVFERWWEHVEEHGATRAFCLHRHSARERLGEFF